MTEDQIMQRWNEFCKSYFKHDAVIKNDENAPDELIRQYVFSPQFKPNSGYFMLRYRRNGSIRESIYIPEGDLLNYIDETAI